MTLTTIKTRTHQRLRQDDAIEYLKATKSAEDEDTPCCDRCGEDSDVETTDYTFVGNHTIQAQKTREIDD